MQILGDIVYNSTPTLGLKYKHSDDGSDDIVYINNVVNKMVKYNILYTKTNTMQK